MAGFNAAVAIRLTPYYAQSAGWGNDVAKVCKVLGFKAHYPIAKEFVTAVHDWQRSCLLGHSGLLRTSSRHSKHEGRSMPCESDPDTTSAPQFRGDPRDPVLATGAVKAPECAVGSRDVMPR
jgi:hypothetical protein